MLQNIVKQTKKSIDLIVNFLVMLLSASLVLVVFLQVFSRYALNHPLIWSEELARYLFIWLVFLASVIVFRENRHMGVDFFANLLTARVQHILSIITNIIISLFLILMIVVAPNLICITFRQISPTLNIPIGMIYLSFPVSMLLMLLELVFRVLLISTKGENS